MLDLGLREPVAYSLWWAERLARVKVRVEQESEEGWCSGWLLSHGHIYTHIYTYTYAYAVDIVIKTLPISLAS